MLVIDDNAISLGALNNNENDISTCPFFTLTACAMSEPKGYYQDPVVQDHNVEQWKQWENQQREKADMRVVERNRK